MIGILTFQSTNNFGANLHAIALCNKVNELGIESEIIDYICPSLQMRETAEFKMSPNPKRLIWYLLYGHTLKDKFKSLAKELRLYTQVGPSYLPETIKGANDRYSGFLLGSDVVWSMRISNYDYNYAFAFADNNKMLNAFSSSVGETNLYRDDTQLPYLLRRFNHIAVRDEDAVKWVKDLSGKDATYVCDPTMLYTDQEWDQILKPIKYNGDYVLIYFIDPKGKLNSDAIDYATKHGYKVKIINYGKPISGMETVRPKTLAEFVGLIKHSKAMFTASYHGMLFALFYQREIFYYNRSLKGRMISLASKFGIENHNGDNYGKDIPPINYKEVMPRIDEFRNYSLSILKEILKDYGNR